MPKVVGHEGESVDSLLRRFKRSVNKAGIITDVRKREYYVKPGLKRKLKSEAARKASNKKYKD